MTQTRRRELSPFLVSIQADPDGQPGENGTLREALDACLEQAQHLAIEQVAKTIFPYAVWKRIQNAQGTRQDLYEYYKRYLPDYVAMAPSKNNLGTYFARLIGYGLDPKTGGQVDHLPSGCLNFEGNQLEFIIAACKPGAQRMALQTAIYDPVRDQREARRHFPCLQHLTFTRDTRRQTLTLNAFYALQLLFEKAYGNWLGLMRLGSFVAGETGLRFDRLNCYAGVQKMSGENRPKEDVTALERLIEIATTCAQSTSELVAQ